MSARWRLVLARHGQTPANVSHTLDTVLPGPGLTDLGRQQAAALGRDLVDGVEGPIAVVAHSRAARAIETAGIVADALAVAPVPVDGTYEVQAGDLEGRSDDESVSLFRSTFDGWLQGDLTPRLPGGESGHDVLARARPAIAALCAGHPEGGAVVLVSHGATVRLLATDLIGVDQAPPSSENHLANCGRVVVERVVDPSGAGDGDAGRWRLVAWRHEVPGGLPSTTDVTGDATG